jgi:hypothetical protein
MENLRMMVNGDSWLSFMLRPFPLLYLSVPQNTATAGRQWLTSIILATQEAEIRRIEV